MIGDKYDFKEAEAKWREKWEQGKTYAWNPDEPREGSYIVDTPPPTVSGYLHIGHVYSYTQTDLVARFKRMSGLNVYYPMGFDDNGLPTERLVEKNRNIRAVDMTREQFIEICHEEVKSAEQDFRNLFKSIALSVDWSQEYQTISPDCTKISQMSVLDLFNKDHLYRHLQPTLWDPVDRTALAQAEVVEKESQGVMYDLAFGLEGGGEVIIATTRPELLGACGALLIHPEHPKASALVGKKAISPLYSVPVPILADERADPEKGSGIVMCCTFGDTTDIEWWRDHKLPTRVIIDKMGRLTDLDGFGGADWPSLDVAGGKEVAAQLVGLKVNAARAKTVEILTERGIVRGKVDVTRMVPCAERSGAPLEILVTPQWFVRALDKKQALIDKGRQITWYPEYMRVRYETWVENLKWDWCISRQRFFGVPFPFWYSKRPGEEGKIIPAHPDDLPVNPLVHVPRGYQAHEVEPDPDVMDTWATSSVSPQINSKGISPEFAIDGERHNKLFPASMRPQAHEIIRTWAFYTILKAHLHQDSVPWKDIAISGWCLAQDRSKMSKSKGNVVTPESLLEKYGADVVRYWTATSRLGLDTALSEDVLKVGKRLVTKIFNASRFVALQLQQSFDGKPTTPARDVAEGRITQDWDKWVLAELAETVKGATACFEAYEYADALQLTERFFWNAFCDNYLELVKGRTYGEVGDEAARQSAFYTLWHCLETVLRLFAPALPHVTEEVYSALFADRWAALGSVHARGNWPKEADQAANAGLLASGRVGCEILAGVRKAKSLAQVSLKTPVEWVRIAPAPAGFEALKADLMHAVGTTDMTTVADLPEDGTLATEDGSARLQVKLGEVQQGA